MIFINDALFNKFIEYFFNGNKIINFMRLLGYAIIVMHTNITLILNLSLNKYKKQ